MPTTEGRPIRNWLPPELEKTLKKICKGIEKRYEINFVEIGSDEDHVHFMIQSVPMYSAKKIIQTIKSITAKRIFREHPEVKKKLWGGKFWTSGYYVNTVGQYANAEVIKAYVQNQLLSKFKITLKFNSKISEFPNLLFGGCL